jgi:CheY-like chemotaxis protein
MAALRIHTERVLLVEDDADIRDTIAEVLEEDGFPTAAVDSGREALAHLASADALPAVILLDLMMPGVDGLTVAEELRKNPAWAAIPVVVLSAAGDAAQLADALGAAACLRKPVHLEQLLECVSRFCGAPGAGALRVGGGEGPKPAAS